MTMKNESGRSMVEMLGVLAIIGVLSIGGIAGYTMAMNRYRANEIIDTASKVAIIAMTKNAGAGDAATLSDIDNPSVPCISTSGISSDRYGVVTINLDPACKGVAAVIDSLAENRMTNGGAKCTEAGVCKLNFGEGTTTP